MTFDAVQRVADAVLYEGYVLYPYRASAVKNQFRWQFGVLAPKPVEGDAESDSEPWFSQTECVIEPIDDVPRLSIRARWLRPRGSEHRTGWLEGVPHTLDLEPIDLGATLTTSIQKDVPIHVNGPGEPVNCDAVVRVRAERADGLITLQVRFENLQPWQDAFRTNRDAMLQHSLAGAHLLLGVEGAAFVSLLEPPDGAAVAVARCQNRHTWPVLVGERPSRDVMLSSPIILYDYPAVAKESPGDLCDAAEIDEILSLRILTMTDEEKIEARATDPKARAILDRVESMTADTLTSLHGTMRSTDVDFFNGPPGTPSPDAAHVMIGDSRIEKGSHVRLRPNRRADAMDMFLRDQNATVAGVYHDVDDRTHIAVTIDADPAKTIHEAFGRFFYFDPSEVEPISVVTVVPVLKERV